MGGGMGDWEANRYGIEGSLAGDVCLNCFCQPCSMCQIAHTVGARAPTNDNSTCTLRRAFALAPTLVLSHCVPRAAETAGLVTLARGPAMLAILLRAWRRACTRPLQPLQLVESRIVLT